jgi:hypothetical protein
MGVVAAIIFFWSNRPNPAICNIYPTHLYTRTGTVRINTYIYISHLHSSWTPGVFYTYFYNHAYRLRLEKLLYLELSRSPNGFFKVLLDPGGSSRCETVSEVKRLKFYNGYM